ncbi:MAG: hypothetical protein ACK4HW_04470 [Roseinatronobacter sp.]
MTYSPLRPLAGLGLALTLSACMAAPAPRPAPMTRPAPVAVAPVPAGASTAEQACIAAGQERGLQVLGVAGSREVVSPTGEVQRDVMLRVSRSGAQIEVRCNYQSATDLARIMLI